MESRTRDRLLHALKAAGPQTASVLARRAGITAVGARQHLAALMADGLVGFADERLSVGRPKRTWLLTDAGHGRFPDSHAALTLDLLAAAASVFGSDGLERLMTQREGVMRLAYERRLKGARSLADRVRRLARIRDEEGYMAEARRDRDGTLWLIENHCPVCAAATSCQGLCRSELALFREALGPNVVVERVEHILAGARRCAYRITPSDAHRHRVDAARKGPHPRPA